METRKYKASVLAVSLITMGVMIVIALGISFSALQSRKSSIGSSKSNVAFQAADSGVEVVMQRIKDHVAEANLNNIDPAGGDGFCDGIVNSSEKYKVELKKTDGTAVACGDSVSAIATIKSTGYSSQDSRAIEAAVTCREWCLLMDNAPWFGMNHLATTVFQNKMWVFTSPWPADPSYSEVWSSTDGIIWDEVARVSSDDIKSGRDADGIWEPRGDMVVLVHTDLTDGVEKLWLMGGSGTVATDEDCILTDCPGGKFKIYNDVWKSADGINWAKVTDEAWPRFSGDPANLTEGRARRQFSGVVFGGKMWIAGGWAGDGKGYFFNDVWSSADGENWNKEYDGGGSWSYDGSSFWYPRANHGMFVLDDGGVEKMWIMGGRYDIGSGIYLLNDVWSSSNGSGWTKRSNAGWSPRRQLAPSVFNNQVWIFGGNTDLGTGAVSNEAWYSNAPGSTWTEQIPAPPWSPRIISDQGSLVYKNKIWLISGRDSTGYLQEVWTYQP